MRRLVLFALGACALVATALAVAQLILPGLAAKRLRDRLSKSGQVLSVQVRAFPAIELLWQQADSVTIRMASYRSSSSALRATLDQTAQVDTLDASAQKLTAGLLSVRDAALHKRGSSLSASGRVTDGDLRSAVPFLDRVVPLATNGGQLTLRGTATLLGVTAAVDATVTASAGSLRITPQVPFGGLATLTLFSDPRLQIDSVSAAPASGGFTVAATARMT